MVQINNPSNYNPILVQRLVSFILIPDDIPQADKIFGKNGQDGAAAYYMYAHSSHEVYKATYDCLIPDVPNF